MNAIFFFLGLISGVSVTLLVLYLLDTMVGRRSKK
jgi:hypothetical protein